MQNVDLTYGHEVKLLGGDSLNLEMRKIQNEIERLKLFGSMHTLTNFESLGLTPATATLRGISERLPYNTSLVVDVFGGTQGARMPLPYWTGGSTKHYISGMLIAERQGDMAKCNFTLRTHNYIAISGVNTYISPEPSPWLFSGDGTFKVETVAQLDGRIDNLWCAGVYYIPRNVMVSLADKPSDNGGWLKVYTDNNTASGTRLYEFTENNGSARLWRKVASNQWVSQGNFWPKGRGDSEMDVGDIKVAGNNIVIKKVDGSTIGIA